MKKKRFILAPVLALVLSLFVTGCGANDNTDYNGVSRKELESQAESMFVTLTQIPSDQIDDMVSEYEDAVKKTTDTSEKEKYQMYLDLISGWADTEPLIGDVEKVEGFKVENAGKTIVTTLTVKGSKRNATLVTTYTKYNMQVSAMNVNPVYSLGEKMGKAGLNTLMGICIVFIMLIILSLLIYAFRLIPYFEKKFAEKKKASDTEKTGAKVSTTASTGNDEEIAAAIAAALAYENDMTFEEFTDSFVVRSIRRV